jgi:hypothetical protein
MNTPPTNMDDVIDSRDVIERIEELEAELAPAINVGGADADEIEELTTLKALAEEGEGSPDWEYGETLIRDSYFEEYAQQLAEDCGMVVETGWPNNCIDWKQAAEELQQDYMSVEFDDVEYWIRA